MTRSGFLIQYEMRLFGLLVAALMFTFACNGKGNRQSMDSKVNASGIPQVETSGVESVAKLRNAIGLQDTLARLDTIRLDKKHFSFSTTVQWEEYSTTLISYCYDDTLEDGWVMYGDNGWPIVQKQVLIFNRGGHEIRKHLLPLQAKVCRTRRGEPVQCLVADVQQLCGHTASDGLVEVSGSEPGTGMEIPLFVGIYGFDGSTRFEGYLGRDRKNEKVKIDKISRMESGLRDSCKRMVCVHCRRVEVPSR